MDDMPLANQVMPLGEPSAGIPTYGIYIIEYLDEDGVACRKWHLEGDPTMDTIMGMVEMFKFRICANMYEWDND